MTWPMVEGPIPRPDDASLNRALLASGPIAEDVTVVIPSIPPRAHMLNRALGSVYLQTLKPHDVIIEIDHDHTGAAATRTRGLMKVETEFVAFLDDDDEFLPNHIERLVREQRRTDADIVYPWFWVEGGHDPLGWYGRVFDAGALRAANYIPITVLARTELCKKVGGFVNHPHFLQYGNPATCEDWNMWLALLDEGARFVHLPVRTWTWHHHGHNTQGCSDRWSG
jgi:glycosyltransferase involved in cell wall biosynthesis